MGGGAAKAGIALGVVLVALMIGLRAGGVRESTPTVALSVTHVGEMRRELKLRCDGRLGWVGTLLGVDGPSRVIVVTPEDRYSVDCDTPRLRPTPPT